jgi:hypothetical protein
MLPVGGEGTGAERLTAIGVETRQEEGKILVDNVVFSSAAEKAGIDFDQEVLSIKVPTKRLPKQIIFIPAAALLALIWFVQRGRKNKLSGLCSVDGKINWKRLLEDRKCRVGPVLPAIL